MSDIKHIKPIDVTPILEDKRHCAKLCREAVALPVWAIPSPVQSSASMLGIRDRAEEERQFVEALGRLAQSSEKRAE